jgi:hypothetical protein
VIEVDGVKCGFSLEDVARPDGVKIPKITAIPAGTYPVTIDYSQRFMKMMPHVLDVPLFSGVRIHKGNSSADVEGCIAVGLNKTEDLIYDCTGVFDFIFKKIEEAIAEKRQVNIMILNEQL